MHKFSTTHIPIHCRMVPPLFAFSSFLPLPHIRTSPSLPLPLLSRGVRGVDRPVSKRVCLFVCVCVCVRLRCYLQRCCIYVVCVVRSSSCSSFTLCISLAVDMHVYNWVEREEVAVNPSLLSSPLLSSLCFFFYLF